MSTPAGQATSYGQEGMATALAQYQDRFEKGQATLTQMTTLAESLQSGWSGAASQNFNTAVSNWLQDFRAIQTYTNQMIQALSGTHRTLTSAHEATMEAAQHTSANITIATLPGFGA
jgi:uncharacterized protein YukE